jgi:hypothetical protein
MMIASDVSSWGVSRIRRLGVMTIPAPESDPGSSERGSDACAGERVASGRGELRLVGAVERNDARAARVARRLRTAPPAQLELVSGREGPGPEVVWASLPEQAREQVLVLLARLIGSGAVEESEGGR